MSYSEIVIKVPSLTVLCGFNDYRDIALKSVAGRLKVNFVLRKVISCFRPALEFSGVVQSTQSSASL